ncbi:TPA: hypothetical protein ACG3PC_003719 [Clostridioides difficile]|nr:hypothetical protein [Clostridioides difficile]
MSRLSRFDILKLIKPKIIKYLESLNKEILSSVEILNLLNFCKKELMLPKRTSIDELIDFLLDVKIIKIQKLFLDGKIIKKYIYKENITLYDLALSINKNAYLSHYSAMYINNLTYNVPKVIYINIEQSKKNISNLKLTQEMINQSFEKPFRVTNKVYNIENTFNNIYSLNGKFTDRLGVKKIEFEDSLIEVTNLERTLIDIVVRPQYSGDAFEVLNAYKMAKGKLSTNRLKSMLKKLEYIYPYHQAIGLYMEKAGYEDKQLNLLKSIPINYDFFLTNEMKNPKYSSEWRIYYPSDL